MKKIVSSAPGRICLFGDHQDYLKLPVIACAINRFIRIEATPNKKSVFDFNLLDLNKKTQIDFKSDFNNITKGDFLRTALKVVRKIDCIPDMGYDIEIKSNIPINAGLSSSSALTLAWIQFLLEAFGSNQKSTPNLLAYLAYETEVLEQGSSGGKMDQYTIGLGNLIYLDTKNDAVTSFEKPLNNLVVGVSGVSKDTFGTLSFLKSNAWEAIDKVTQIIPKFKISKAKVEDQDRYLNLLDERQKPFLYAAINNHAITQKAKVELQNEHPDLRRLGEMMNEHHYILKEYLKITPPRIDKMIENALNAGAFGAKIVGSGGGGCIVAIATPENEQEVINALLEAGAIDAFSAKITAGANIKNYE